MTYGKKCDIILSVLKEISEYCSKESGNFQVQFKIQSYGNEMIAQKETGIKMTYKDRSVVLHEGQLQEQRYTFKLNFNSGTHLHLIVI